MEKSKKNLLFVIINILLVAVVGVILGICLPLASNNAMLLSYCLLLVTLLCPMLVYFTVKNATSPIGIASLVFLVGNIATLIVFMFNVKEIKVVGITEAAIVGAYLAIMLVCIACLKKKD